MNNIEDMVKFCSLALFAIFLTAWNINAAPLIVDSYRYGPATCVYYEYGYSDAQYCHTVRQDNEEDWYHRYGDVTCDNNCGTCSHMTIRSYIYDKYGSKWVSFLGWSGQKMSIPERNSLIARLEPYKKPAGDINTLPCEPEVQCGQLSSITFPLMINSETYGQSTCVYYEYSKFYEDYGHTHRADRVNAEGWLHSNGDVTCQYNCQNNYHLSLTTYIFNKNTNQWVAIRGWTGQKIGVHEGCDLLEEIKMHIKPPGDINMLECLPYLNPMQYGPPSTCD